MGIVRPLHARSRVGEVPALRHRGDQPVRGDGDQLGMGAGPAVDDPNTRSPTADDVTPSPMPTTTPAYSDPSTWTGAVATPHKARLIQGSPDR